ncbi:MAG TPA: TldD/PmbA family protein [Anaerolineae bacterium]|nr:TldD/PmbA family protein [Anaerolineae bacterium]HPL29823.1 TldD/PmbA family protein [Anaerolineae bacterium]
MNELAERALNVAQLHGASYADVRVVRRERQELAVKNGQVGKLAMDEEQGFGVRVIADGAWGFASSSLMTMAEVERVAALAVTIARASALVKGEGVKLGPPEVHVGSYRTAVVRDPFAVATEDKLALLLAADEAMRRVPGVRVSQASLEFLRETKLFTSSEGSRVEQVLIESGAGLETVAVGEGEMQKRSYPNSFGRHQGTAGYEFVEELDLVGHAQPTAAEAVALLKAPTCPSGVMTLIIGGSQLGLQVHESCGHPTELDRVFGSEASYAGTSFLTPEKLGTFRYGSPVVNLTADATLPGGLGSFGYDDEGVPAQRAELVREGLFVGYLTSRETAARLGLRSNGTMRADGWNRMPIIRMTNINLEPGTWTLADLIADTDEGLFVDLNKSWSIDDKRLNFQFGTEVAYEITKGRLGRLYKNATYTGITPQFWGSCDAICGPAEWRIWGIPNCGKGQPPQSAHVGHGTAPARFRNVQVGVMR